MPLTWFPLTVEKDSQVPGSLLFRRRNLRRTLRPVAGEDKPPISDGKPLGTILQGKDGLFEIEEREVPRSGGVLTRFFQIARTADGQRLLWSGRRKRVGKGAGASALRWLWCIDPFSIVWT